MSNFTFHYTYDQFKQLSRDFFQAIPTASEESLHEGFKCLGLAYLGVEFGDHPAAPLHREVSAPAIMRLAVKKMLARELELACAGENASEFERVRPLTERQS